MREHLADHSPHSRYYYSLTVKLIVRRLGKWKDWGCPLQCSLQHMSDGSLCNGNNHQIASRSGGATTKLFPQDRL